MDNKKIEKLMHDHRDAVQACYDRAVDKNHSIGSGRLVLRADQNPDGTLSRIREIESFPDSEPVTECITKEVSKWSLGNFYSRGDVELAWNFTNARSGLEQTEMQNAVANHRGDFEKCYEDSLKADPTVKEGTLKLNLKIAASGKLNFLEMVSGFPGAAAVYQCLQKKASAWEFPKRNKASSFGYSWTFKQKAAQP